MPRYLDNCSVLLRHRKSDGIKGEAVGRKLLCLGMGWEK